jgi:hypothetical protein
MGEKGSRGNLALGACDKHAFTGDAQFRSRDKPPSNRFSSWPLSLMSWAVSRWAGLEVRADTSLAEQLPLSEPDKG